MSETGSEDPFRVCFEDLSVGQVVPLGACSVDAEGIVIAQHDLLDEGGRLVFSCLTRALFTRRT